MKKYNLLKSLPESKRSIAWKNLKTKRHIVISRKYGHVF